MANPYATDPDPPPKKCRPNFRKKNLSENFVAQFWGQKWLRQCYGRLKFCVLLQEKSSMPTKFLVLRGLFWVLGVPILFFMGVGIFLRNETLSGEGFSEGFLEGATIQTPPQSAGPNCPSLAMLWCNQNLILAAQCEIPPHIAEYLFEIVSQTGVYRTHLPCFHRVSRRNR